MKSNANNIEVNDVAQFLSYINPFKPSVAFNIETSDFMLQSITNGWFLDQMQHWAKMGWLICP